MPRWVILPFPDSLPTFEYSPSRGKSPLCQQNDHFARRRAPRRRLPDSAVGLPQGPAVTFMPRRLRAFWPRNTWAGAPTLQHPPFPQVWCGPPNRTSCMPVAQTDGSIPMHECRHLSPPGCFRIRLRIPPSLSWRNIGACRSAGPPNSRLFARISSVDV